MQQSLTRTLRISIPTSVVALVVLVAAGIKAKLSAMVCILNWRAVCLAMCCVLRASVPLPKASPKPILRA